MSGLFGGGSKQQAPPALPPPPPADTTAPEIQAAGAAERLRLRQRRGREKTQLTGGALIAPETGEAGAGTLLGGGARR